MSLLNPLALAHDLSKERLSEGVKARYLVIGIVIQYLYRGWRAASGSPATSVGWDVGLAAAVVVGVYLCFRANAAGDNRRFVERYICLSVSLSLWTLLIGLLLGFGMLYGLGMDRGTYAQVGTILNLVIWVAYFSALWWLMRIAARTAPPETPSVQPDA